MGLFKKKLTAYEAGDLYFRTLLDSLNSNWESDINSINLYIHPGVDPESGNAFMEFVIASTALGLRSVINMSIEHYPSVFIAINDLLAQIENIDCVNILQKEYLPAMRRAENEGTFAHDGALSVLFNNLGIERDPIAGTAILTVLVSRIGIWKEITRKYKIV